MDSRVTLKAPVDEKAKLGDDEKMAPVIQDALSRASLFSHAAGGQFGCGLTVEPGTFRVRSIQKARTLGSSRVRGQVERTSRER